MNVEAVESTKKIVEDLKLSSDEIDRLTKAFKNPEFKKLFQEYAEEISSPENKKRYEDEIRQMEEERGMDIEFITPRPGFVLKTSQNGDKKVFINMCQSDKIQSPSIDKTHLSKNKSGVLWSIPHSFSPPREDLDKTRQLCVVYDVVFHPDTLYMAKKNQRYQTMVESTALDGIEKNFQVKLDRKNIRRPKMLFKGVPVATVIRTKKPEYEHQKKPAEVPDSVPAVKPDPLAFPYPYNNKENKEETKKSSTQLAAATSALAQVATAIGAPAQVATATGEPTKAAIAVGVPTKEKEVAEPDPSPSPYATPQYTVRYSEDFDLQNFHNSDHAETVASRGRPNKIIIHIHLPLLKSAACIDLDITERFLKLHVEKPSAYHLEMKLSYPVKEDLGNAVFNKALRELVITLPVQPISSAVKMPFGSDVVDSTEKEEEKEEDEEVTEAGDNNALSTSSGAPLIEVLASEDYNSASISLEPEANLPQANVISSTVSEPVRDRFDQLCKHQNAFSDVTFRQDNQCIVVCLAVKHVLPSSVRLYHSVSEANVMLLIQCRSQPPSGCFPMLFGVFLLLPTSQALQASIQFTVNPFSLCLEIPKNPSDSLWSEIQFTHQLDPLNVKTFQFEEVTLHSHIMTMAKQYLTHSDHFSYETTEFDWGEENSLNDPLVNLEPVAAAAVFDEMYAEDMTLVESSNNHADQEIWQSRGDANLFHDASSSDKPTTNMQRKISVNENDLHRTLSVSSGKSVTFPQELEDTTWFDCKETVSQFRRRLGNKRKNNKKRMRNRKRHNSHDSEANQAMGLLSANVTGNPDNSPLKMKATIRKRSVSESEIVDSSNSNEISQHHHKGLLKNVNTNENNVSEVVETSSKEIATPVKKLTPNFWKEFPVHGPLLTDVTSGENILDHRTNSAVPIDLELALELDLDEVE